MDVEDTGDDKASIYHLNGFFLVFEPKHALLLRRKRIVSQPICGGSTCPSHGPYYLSFPAVSVIVRYNLATFKKLTEASDRSAESNRLIFENSLAKVIESEKALFKERRLEELKKRDITPTQKTIKVFDESKLRLTLPSEPDKECSSFRQIILSKKEVLSSLDQVLIDIHKNLVYTDMYDRGFFLSSGMKFGGDFLAYVGDPVLYHAQFVIRVIRSSTNGLVDLSNVDHNNLNGFQRLTHTAKKIPLFATVVTKNIDVNSLMSSDDYQVKYWTLKEREYLNVDSKETDFDSIDPNPQNTSMARKRILFDSS